MSQESRSLTRHGKDRKAELLHHAEVLFAERGYEDTRMVDIAAAAGVAKGLVYWYFENKDTLFDEIVVDMGQRLRRAQGRAMAGIDDPLERLYVGTAESVRFIADNYRLYGIISSQVRGDRRLRETRVETQRVQADDATALLAEGQQRRVVRSDDDPAVLAHANAGVVYYYVLLYADGRASGGRRGLDIEQAAHAAARYVVRAVGADDAAITAVLDRQDTGGPAVAPRRRARPTAATA
ncbi:MAG TPA: TetR family transcriptional regulator [Acidimicrobiales bacterium]|nr:TetR family transcriptional regulator [Acidimicrobiales bacterium]